MEQAARERRIWSSIHRWLGIGLGAWFALVRALQEFRGAPRRSSSGAAAG